MANIKISSKVDEAAWAALKSVVQASQQSISGLLTEAIQEYLQRRRVRPVVLDHLKDSVDENREMGELLVK